VVLVGGPDEAHLTPPVEEALGGAALSLVGRTTLPQLVAVLREADAVVSNDSGPLHLADALARPVVAPYTCTSPIRTGPYRRPHGACLTDVTCAASYLKTCGRMVCMPDLTPDRLWPALQGILSTCQRRSA
jgi:ADP-heptose:LPS heptosyltransferase